jgi:hypothetical protein
MQVVSGPIGKRKVPYDAPPAARVPEEMARFLNWFESSRNADPLLTAGLAHLWFSVRLNSSYRFTRKSVVRWPGIVLSWSLR